MSRVIPSELINRVAANTDESLTKVVHGIGTSKFVISKRKILETAECLLKDLYRLSDAQDNQISDTKYAAYWGFWIRKIKPIREAWKTVGGQEIEITDINERAALELAISFLKKSKKHPEDLVRARCGNGMCDGAQCIEAFLSRYFTFQSNIFSEYLVYSLGRRTFGPHHLCAVLDAVLFASCTDPGGTTAAAFPSVIGPR